MSSEISTYLTGRYVSIPVYTLSFREYLVKAGSGLLQKELLEQYIYAENVALRFGGHYYGKPEFTADGLAFA